MLADTSSKYNKATEDIANKNIQIEDLTNAFNQLSFSQAKMKDVEENIRTEYDNVSDKLR